MKRIPMMVHTVMMFSFWVLILASLFEELLFIEKIIISVASLVLVITYRLSMRDQDKYIDSLEEK